MQQEKIIYHFSDQLWGGNIDLNETWVILQAIDYLPFWQTRTQYNSTEYKNKYQFTWKERDAENGYDYFEARYYDNGNGRFRSIDRMFWEIWNTQRGIENMYQPQNLNAYSYVTNNPLIYTDPDGEEWEFVNGVKTVGSVLWLQWAGTFIWASIWYTRWAVTWNQNLMNASKQGLTLANAGELAMTIMPVWKLAKGAGTVLSLAEKKVAEKITMSNWYTLSKHVIDNASTKVDRKIPKMVIENTIEKWQKTLKPNWTVEYVSKWHNMWWTNVNIKVVTNPETKNVITVIPIKDKK